MQFPNRSAKMLALVRNSTSEYETLQLLSVPSYESTKGTEAYERELYLNAIRSIHLENASPLKPVQEDTVTSSWKRREVQKRKSVEATKRKLDLGNQEDHVYRTVQLHQSPSVDENVTTNVESDKEDPFIDSGDEYIPSSSVESSFSETTETEYDSDTINTHRSQSRKEKKSQRKKNNISEIFVQNTTSAFPCPLDASDYKFNISRTTDTIEENGLQDKEVWQKEDCKERRLNLEEVSKSAMNVEEEGKGLEGKEASEVLTHIDECQMTDSESDREGVTVSVVKRNMEGERCRDKRHCCYICNKLLSNNMARHFELKHGNDIQVAKILAMPKGSKTRRDEFEMLIKAGDFYYNCNVLTIKEGELILVRRPEVYKKMCYGDFGPCPYCLGFMAKKYLWHHLRQCKIKKNLQINRMVKVEGDH